MTPRYILFAGSSFYANGGSRDVLSSGNDLGALRVIAKAGYLLFPDEPVSEDNWRRSHDWWHILDTSTMTIVAGKSGSYCGKL